MDYVQKFRGDLGKFNCLDVLMRFGYVNWVCAWVIASPVCCLVACLVLVLVEQSLLVEQPKKSVASCYDCVKQLSDQGVQSFSCL